MTLRRIGASEFCTSEKRPTLMFCIRSPNTKESDSKGSRLWEIFWSAFVLGLLIDTAVCRNNNKIGGL